MGCNTSPLALGRKDAPGYLTLQGWSWSAGALLASGGSALPRTPVPRSWPGETSLTAPPRIPRAPGSAPKALCRPRASAPVDGPGLSLREEPRQPKRPQLRGRTDLPCVGIRGVLSARPRVRTAR